MNIEQQIHCYDASLPLTKASTPPSSWYTCTDIAKLESDSVFSNNWLLAARVEQLQKHGDYVATTIANQPVLLVKENNTKAFYNVCQHHAAQVMANGSGCTNALVCPYHAWRYGLDGKLKNAPRFSGVELFDVSKISLKPIHCTVWQHWVFINFSHNPVPFEQQFAGLIEQFSNLSVSDVTYYSSSHYQLNCNWKVYVDNYLDGGYHVPILHKGLSSALDNRHYQIANGERYNVQSCPTKVMVDDTNPFANVRSGTARYYWHYPNMMFNFYDGILGTMVVEPLAVDKCQVQFDYYFNDQLEKITDAFKQHSVAIADKIQAEDAGICESVQQGLASKGYDTGRLSVDKESGEHLFHRLLYNDLSAT
ncbi:aromatic ring-hydroxylating dioxygenase subunit alpha [Thalassotalea maritima]|uniref:aromatic ring-hydroxylating oxygenase subunit alpha n=1 Tax=Thalassotalea maritima TaxID=3242416 RepID=UPI0035278611